MVRDVRLACLTHAASVHPELGSNSKYKLFALIFYLPKQIKNLVNKVERNKIKDANHLFYPKLQFANPSHFFNKLNHCSAILKNGGQKNMFGLARIICKYVQILFHFKVHLPLKIQGFRHYIHNQMRVNSLVSGCRW